MEMQKKIESTVFEPGWTNTAEAMEKALALFKKEQRKDKDTARVCHAKAQSCAGYGKTINNEVKKLNHATAESL